MEILFQDVSRKQAIPDEERFNRIFNVARRIFEADYEASAHARIQEIYGIAAAEMSDLEMTLAALDVTLDWHAKKTDDEVAHAWAAAMWQALGQQIVARRLERKVPREPRRRWIEQATAASERRAHAMDQLEQLTDDELRRRREELTAKAVGSGEGQKAALESLEDIEAVAAARGIEPREEQYTGRVPVPKRVNLRARIEEGIRRLGSFDKAVEEIRYVDKTSGTASDLEFFVKEANAFKGVFKERARQTAMDMLADSVNAIKAIVESYGLPWDMTTVAVRDVMRGGDVAKEVAEVVELAAKQAAIKGEDPRYAEKRGNLASTTRGLKKLQQSVAEKAAVSDKYFQDFRRAKDQGAFERTYGAAARAADKELAAAREHLAASWVEAEAAHPVLMSLRRSGELEKVDLNRLTNTSTEDRMVAVLRELVPKLRDANIAANKIRDKQLNPLALPAVVALTRATMFVPKGSIRDGAINDAVSDAKDEADSTLLKIATFALVAITFIPSGGASLTIPVAIAAVGLASYTATQEWEKYSTQKVLTNTHLDLARSLATEEPSLTSFAISLAAIGLEALPLAGAFAKARRLKRLVAAGEETGSEARAIVKELNSLGKTSDDIPLGRRALDDIHGAPGGAKPREVVGKIEAQKPPAKAPSTGEHGFEAGAKGDKTTAHTGRSTTTKPVKDYEQAEVRASTVSSKSTPSKLQGRNLPARSNVSANPKASDEKIFKKLQLRDTVTHGLDVEAPGENVMRQGSSMQGQPTFDAIHVKGINQIVGVKWMRTNVDYLAEHLRSAKLYEEWGIGPKVYGVIERPSEVGMVTDIVGVKPQLMGTLKNIPVADVPEAVPQFITDQTIKDVEAMVTKMWGKGYTPAGDFQFLVTRNGRAVAIDPGKLERVPNPKGASQFGQQGLDRTVQELRDLMKKAKGSRKPNP